MPEWVAIQRNPTSGAGPKAAVLKELVRELKQHGLKPRLFSKRERLASLLVDETRRENLRCIVAAGGDGTVVDVINRYPGMPMTVCPLGTENLFAKYLGIPRSGRAVAETIANGQPRQLDLCELQSSDIDGNPHPAQRFLIMASIGFDAAVVHRTHARRRGHIRRSSYVLPIFSTLWHYRYPKLQITLDDNEPVESRLAVVANLPRYALKLPIASSAKGDDGLIDVRLFERPSRRSMLRYFWKVWRNKHESLADVRSALAKTIRIDADEPVPIQVDGDPAGFTPATITVVPSALTVVAPHVLPG